MSPRVERAKRNFEHDFERALRNGRRDRATNDARNHLDSVKAERGEEYARDYSQALHSLTASKDCRVTVMRTETVKSAQEAEIERVFGATKPTWSCPINSPGCTRNCGNYGCGN